MRGFTSSWSVSSTSITQACSGFAELRRGQADAGRIAHRVGEVVEQLVQVLAEAVDRLALQAQPRIAEHDDGSDGHAAEYMERARRLRRRRRLRPYRAARARRVGRVRSAVTGDRLADFGGPASRDFSASLPLASAVASPALWASGAALSAAIATTSAALAENWRTTGVAFSAKSSTATRRVSMTSVALAAAPAPWSRRTTVRRRAELPASGSV